MTDALVSPSHPLTIAGKEYRLDGSFMTLRAVQEAFRKDIVQVLIGIMEMRTDEIAKLISVAVAASHHSLSAPTPDEIGQDTRLHTHQCVAAWKVD